MKSLGIDVNPIVLMLSTLVLESQEEKMMKLDHVLEKLKNLDPKTFGMLNNMISSAEGGHSFLQVSRFVCTLSTCTARM